jgi:large subunit ribosomal protein L31
MKKDKHPLYQDVVFVDSSSGLRFTCGTTASGQKEKEKKTGKESNVIPVSISAASHPYFVGGKQFVDAEGRVDRFNKRYQNAAKAAPKQQEEPVVEVKVEEKAKTKKKK